MKAFINILIPLALALCVALPVVYALDFQCRRGRVLRVRRRHGIPTLVPSSDEK